MAGLSAVEAALPLKASLSSVERRVRPSYIGSAEALSGGGGLGVDVTVPRRRSWSWNLWSILLTTAITLFRSSGRSREINGS